MLYRYIKKIIPLIFFLVASSYSYPSTPLEEEASPPIFEMAAAELSDQNVPAVQNNEPSQQTPNSEPALPQVEAEESQLATFRFGFYVVFSINI